MAKVSLIKMSVSELLDLRNRIQAELASKIAEERAGLQRQIDALSQLEGISTGPAAGRRRGRRPNAVRGLMLMGEQPAKPVRKVEPKFRGPEGEIWSGRGNTPRWLVALEAEGKKRENYLINK